jgi:type IV secretory pathway VirB10-like protein
MDARYREDGDPYARDERRPPLVKPWVWGALAVAAIGGMAYAWWPRHWAQVPVIDEKKAIITEAVWNGYPSATAPKLQQAVSEPDPRVDALQRQLRAMQDEQAKLREMLQQSQNRPAPDPQRAHAPASQAAPAPKPVPQRHRDMGYLAFAQPEEKTEAEPLYVLAPADTKIGCTVEAKQNSDVESVGTVKVNVNVFDTDSRRRLLIPQGSTILVKYQSRNLVYGNQRLPEHSAMLTLPNGTTKELNEEPVMDQVGQAGLVSSVDNHFWRAVPAILIQGVLRGSQQTISSTNPVIGGVAGSVAQYGQRITQPYIDTRPTIVVEAGEECLVILTRTIQLPEYKEVRARKG